MLKVIRHDAITLNGAATETEFERFMKKELFPYFSKRYKGPTRTSVADLKHQSLLKDSKGQRKYLWTTVWEGSLESVRGSSFQNTRMVRLEETEAMLKKLAAFGKRSSERLFSECLSVAVGTNR